MKILAYDHTNEGVSFEDLRPHLAEEAREAWELYKRGILREFYLRADGKPGAVVILECADVAEAESLMRDMPLVRNGLITFTFVPLGYFMPFEALFGTSQTDRPAPAGH